MSKKKSSEAPKAAKEKLLSEGEIHEAAIKKDVEACLKAMK